MTGDRFQEHLSAIRGEHIGILPAAVFPRLFFFLSVFMFVCVHTSVDPKSKMKKVINFNILQVLQQS